MNRSEASALLKELFDSCPFLEGKSFALMPPNADSVLSKDYKIHIKAALDGTTLLCLRKITHKHNIALNDEKDRIIIYEPQKSAR